MSAKQSVAAADDLIKGSIGRAELFSLALALMFGGVLLTGRAEKLWAQQSCWAVILAVVGGIIFPLLLAAWVRLFAGQSMGQSLQFVFGRGAARLLLFILAVLWLVQLAAAVACAAFFWADLGTKSSALLLYAALFLLVAACFAAGGGVALGRVALLVVCPALVLVFANLLLTVSGADKGNLLPLILPDHTVLPDALIGGLLIFGNLTVLLPFLYHTEAVKNQTAVIGRAAVWLGLLWLIFSLCAVAVLGASLPLYDFPLLQIFRLAEVGNWFSRFEVMGAALLLMVLLIRASVLFAAAVSVLAELWRLDKRRQIWLLVGGIAVLIWLLLTAARHYGGDLTALLWFGGHILPWLLLISAVVIPVVTILGAWLRLRFMGRTVIIRHLDGDN